MQKNETIIIAVAIICSAVVTLAVGGDKPQAPELSASDTLYMQEVRYTIDNDRNGSFTPGASRSDRIESIKTKLGRALDTLKVVDSATEIQTRDAAILDVSRQLGAFGRIVWGEVGGGR